MLVLDIEGSGTNYEKHSIVSIGAFDSDAPERRFYGECRIWDGAHIMDDALVVNGFSENEITTPDKMSEAELITQFLEWTQHIADRTILGQNPSFDRDMLKAAVRRADLNWDLAYRTLDTHTMCYMHMIQRGERPPLDMQHKRSALNLDTILRYCGIPAEPQPHNALTGALCHGEVASRLLYGKSLLHEFSKFPLPW